MIAEVEIPVRYAETDKMGVVYHANYLVYCEVARTVFLEKLGHSYAHCEQLGYMAPVVNVNLSYGAPLTYGDTALVRTCVTKVTPVRTEYAYEVYKAGQQPGVDKPCCWGTSVHCAVDADTFKPLSLKRCDPELFELYKQALESEGFAHEAR